MELRVDAPELAAAALVALLDLRAAHRQRLAARLDGAETVAPPGGTGPLVVKVAVEEPPPVKMFGLRERLCAQTRFRRKFLETVIAPIRAVKVTVWVLPGFVVVIGN